ncbi:hypothetical protein ACOSP7_020307 [Xanthoceras sorbifolium]
MWYCQIHHPVNGYLIDDTCVFGAEVFVVKNSSKERNELFASDNDGWGCAEFLSMAKLKDPKKGYLVDDTLIIEAERSKSGFQSRSVKRPSTYLLIAEFVYISTSFSATLLLFSIEEHESMAEAATLIVEEKFVSESFGYYKWNVLLCPNGNGRGKGNCISIFLEVPRSSIPANTKLFLKYILRVKDQKNGKHVYTEGNELFASNKAVLGLPEFLSLAKLKDPKMGYLVDDTLIIEAEVTLLGLVLPKS